VDPSLIKMSEDEIRDVHERHRREEKTKLALLSKADFEVNQEEDSDEDFAGPKIELFTKQDDER
jgi:hypothetical protein